MPPADASAPRRPKRKRSRKARTAVVSSDESSEEAPKPSAAPAARDDDSDTAAADDFDQDAAPTSAMDLQDLSEIDDELRAPSLTLPLTSKDDESTPATKTVIGAKLASMTPAALSAELAEKQRTAFHALYMEALTEEFGEELDALRQVGLVFSRRTTRGSRTTPMRVRPPAACPCSLTRCPSARSCSPARMTRQRIR